jgi:hypothetical protein
VIEEWRNAVTTKPEARAAQLATDQAVESAALAGAVAIQRLIAERDSLRNRASTQERELMTLRATNEDFRRNILLIRQRYIEFATTFLAFDDSIREVILMQPTHGASARSEEATLIDLAQRFAPNNRHSWGPQGGKS